jgi:hypothetical protein
VGVTLYLEGIFYGKERSKVPALFRGIKEKSGTNT